MSEEKLTVAELLARRNKEREASGDAEDRPRRRRHRSLEEGGISVAELTGSIPKVRADGPRRGAHAVGEDEGQRGETAPAQVDETVEAPAEVSAPAPTPASADVSAPAVAPEEVAAPEVSAAPEAPADAEAAVVTRTVPEAPADPEPPAQPEPAAESRSPFAVPPAVPVDPRPVLANEDTGEITFTFTKLRDARTGEDDVADAGPMALEVLEGSMAYDDRPTSIIPVIADDEPATEVAESTESADFTESMDVTEAAATEAADRAEPTAAYAAPALDRDPRDGTVDATESAANDAGDMEDNSLSIGLLIVQTIVGVLFGGLVFALFTMLWMVLPTAVVAVIAVVFAFGLVVVVNLVRRQRDRLTPVLAGIVGLVVSFAPWALTVL